MLKDNISNMDFLSDSDSDSDSKLNYSNQMLDTNKKIKFKFVKLSEIIKSKRDFDNILCKNYRNIEILGTVKNVKLVKAKYSNGISFSLFEKEDKIDCIHWGEIEILDNNMYKICGSITDGLFGLQLRVIPNGIIPILQKSDFQKLIQDCENKKYFCNKKKINIEDINNIIILSKKGTQGLSDFTQNLRIPLNIDIKNISLESKNTKFDIIKSIKKINEDYMVNKCDLILILRGGGDTSNISNIFDNIDIFDCIKNSKIPVGTAIGHTDDKSQRLLINEISDINFNTPTSAAEEINKVYISLFCSLYYNIQSYYKNIILNKLSEVQDFYEKYYEKKLKKINTKLSKLKNDLIEKMIGNLIIKNNSLSINDNNYVYIEGSNYYGKYKIEFIEKIHINPIDINSLHETDTLSEFQCLIKKLNIPSNNCTKLIIEQLTLIEKLNLDLSNFNNLSMKKNKKLLFKLLPKLDSKNCIQQKEILLFYNSIFDNDTKIFNKKDIILDNNLLNKIKNIDIKLINESSDILHILDSIKFLTGNLASFNYYK